jgi:hypothetical protein
MPRSHLPARSPAAERLAVALLLGASLIGAGCKGDGGSSSGPASSASAPSSASPAPSGSAPANAGSAAAAPPETYAPQGAGVEEIVPVASVAECQPKEVELGSYLQRGEISIAARDGAIAASWMVQLPNKQDAQIAFGGYDGQAKQTARVRGIGTSREHAPQVFATGSEFTVTWFDSDGLAHTKPTWELGAARPTEHLGAFKKEIAGNVGLASTPAGSLVAVAPFGLDQGQLSLFLFAPTDPAAPPVRALAVSRRAKKPSRPSVSADAAGFTVAWLEEDASLFVARFDLEGKEAEGAKLVAPGGTDRQAVSLVPAGTGTLALWAEGDSIVARPLDVRAQPSGPARVVAKGAKWPKAAALGDGALVCWVGQGGPKEGRLQAVRLKGDGSPSSKGLEFVGEGRAVKDPPACAVAGGRAALAWMEVMSATVSTKRALLRTIEASCLP